MRVRFLGRRGRHCEGRAARRPGLFYDVVGPYVSVSPRFVATANGAYAPTAGAPPSANWAVTASIRADAGLTGEIHVPGIPSLSTLVNDGIKRAQFNLWSAEKQWSSDL